MDVFLSEFEREEAIAIVDPYSSGRFLVEELKKRGWPLVAVRSCLTIDQVLLSTWNPAPFSHVVVHHGSVEETVEVLRSFKPLRAVIAGSEPGVELTEALAAALSLRGNSPELPRPRCRWDKFDMHEQLRESGLRACQQKIVRDAEEALAFARKLGSWPIVAKPRHSMGEACVHLSEDEASLSEAVKAVLSSKDTHGLFHTEVVVQEFLQGTEYVVDCVSRDGEHLACAVWVYSKTRTETGFAYDTTRTVPYDGEEGSLQQRLLNYVFKCLTALGVRNGASHSEVVVSGAESPEGICLVKLGARMHGSMGPALWVKCAGREQAQPFLMADLFAEGGKFLERKIEAAKLGGAPFILSRTAMQIDLQCPVSGVLAKSVESSSGEWLRSLQTFSSMRLFVEEGDLVVPTKDLSKSPGFVVLLGSDEAVERDLKSVRNREREGKMYIIEKSLHNDAVEKARAELAASRRGCWNPTARLRELDAEAEKLISPLASRAASPLLSPQQAPALPPELGVDGAFGEFTLDGEPVEFTLDGADGLDDFALDDGGDLGSFSLDGPIDGGPFALPGQGNAGGESAFVGSTLFGSRGLT